MILAAGRGERMRPLTDHTPKPLLPVQGKPLIVYHLQALAHAGYQRVVINLAHLGGQIRAALGDGKGYGLQIHYLEEGETALETGGGIRNALHLLGDTPFLVINADVFTNHPLVAPELAFNDLAHLVLVANPAHHTAGDFALQAGRIRGTGAPRYTYAGIGWFRPELFRSRPPGRFPLAPLLRQAIATEQVAGSYFTGLWTDVGTPERLAELDRPQSADATA